MALIDLFDTLGSLPVIAIVGAIGIALSLVRGARSIALAFLVGLASEAPTTLVKYLFDRARPPASSEIEAVGSIASYPSGHTVRAVVIAGLLVAAFAWHHRSAAVRRLSLIAAGAFVVLVGLARVASAQHWPTDVLGGLLLGLTWLIVCVSLAAMIDRRIALPSTG